MLSMRSVKCHQIKMVQVVSNLVMPDSVKWSGGAPHHFSLSPHQAYLRLSVLDLTVDLYYTVLMFNVLSVDLYQCPKLSFYFVHSQGALPIKLCTRKLLHAPSQYITMINGSKIAENRAPGCGNVHAGYTVYLCIS